MGRFHAVLINVGSPLSPEVKDVKSFLGEFLMDPNVLQMPWILRSLLVHLIIIPRRASYVAERYREIWSRAGCSPIICNTERLVGEIEERLRAEYSDAGISYAMLYGGNIIDVEFERLAKLGVDEILAIPQYPQYEHSTYVAAVHAAKRAAKRYKINVRFTPPFFNHGDYISTLERSLREALTGNPVDKLIFSFHAIPLSYLPCGERSAKRCEIYDAPAKSSLCAGCYRLQCYETARLASERLMIERGEYCVAFQSQMQHKKWLYPTLASTLSSLPSQSIDSVAVIAPSFTADCLETLHEIDIEGRELFMQSGGREFRYVAALNDQELWAKKLSKWILEAEKQLI